MVQVPHIAQIIELLTLMLYTDDFLQGCPSTGQAGFLMEPSSVECVYDVWSLCAAKDKLKITNAMVYEFCSDSVIVVLKHLSVT